jgi:hypothetical protein
MERDVEQFEKDLVEFVRKAEESALDAGRKWAKSVGELVPLEVPAVRQVVKEVFDYTEEVLKLQRQFAFNVLKAMSPAPKGKTATHAATTARAPRATTAHPRTRTTRVA